MKRGAVAQQIGILLAAFAFIYAAALGPIGAYIVMTDKTADGRVAHAVKIIYLPVIALAKHSAIVDSALFDYRVFWVKAYKKFKRHPQAERQSVSIE